MLWFCSPATSSVEQAVAGEAQGQWLAVRGPGNRGSKCCGRGDGKVVGGRWQVAVAKARERAGRPPAERVTDGRELVAVGM